MKIYCPSLSSYSLVLSVGLDTAMVSQLIKGCAHHAHLVDLQTKVRQIYVSSAKQAGTALQMVPPLRCHASHVCQKLTLHRRDLASAYHVPPVVLVLTMELPSTFHVQLVGIIALQIRPSVWHALAGSMDRMKEQPYVLIVH